MVLRWLTRVVLTVLIAGAAVSGGRAQDLENTLYLDTDHGRVVIALRPDLAPKHVARIKELTRQKFYDGLLFHRVIDGFMAQAQDPNSGESQFFIMFAPGDFLNGKYTVWGRVVSGMEYVDKIKRGEPPRSPDKIVRMQVAADAK